MVEYARIRFMSYWASAIVAANNAVTAPIDDLPNTLNLETGDTPVIGVGTRMATVHEGFRQHVGRGLGAVTEGVEAMVRKGIADGQIAGSVDPRQVAHVAMILAHGIQMAILLGHEEVVSEESRRWIAEYLNSLRA